VPHALAVYQVTTAIDGPRPVYRASFDFGFELPSPETSVVVDPAAAELAGTFQPLDLTVSASAISSASPPVVTLDGPREVRNVSFKPGKSFAGKHVQLFRLDQNHRAPEATVSATVGSGNSASGFGGFTDVRFVVGVQDGGPQKSELASITVRGAPLGGRLGIADPADPDSLEFFWPTPQQIGTVADAGEAFGKALATYLEGKRGELEPTARLVMQADQPCRFALSKLDTGTSFAVDGFAFPVLLESDLLDAGALAARIHAAADPVSAYLRGAIGKAALLDGLNAVIGAPGFYDAERFAGVTLREATQAALAAGGDSARLNRLLLQDAYPDAIAPPAVSRVLRFGEGAVAEATVAIALPPGATITKATVSTQEALLADRPLGDALVDSTSADSHVGVHVGGSGTVALGLAVEIAVSATGIALPLVPLVTGSEVAVELQEDYLGAPSGKQLAAAVAALASPGVVRWTTVSFDAVVLPSGTVWLVLRAAKGEAVWLTAPAEDAGLRVLRTSDDGASVESVLPGLAAQYRLYSRSGEALERAATTLSLDGTAVPALRDGDRATYDLTTALQPLAAAGGIVPLTFTGSIAGTITVDPPHVELDLGGVG
jgi:hypothetical protein